MPKSKGRLRKFIRGLGGGGSVSGPTLSEGVVVAAPSYGAANENHPINDHSHEGECSDAVVNGVCMVIRNSTGVCEVQVLDEHDLSKEIWMEAYTGLQNGESTKDMVHVYETILSQQLKESNEQNATQPTNLFSRFGNDIEQKIPQMRLVTESVLSNASGHSAIADGLTKAVGLVSELNGLVSPMIQSNPVAALAWGGICAALPFLLRPITAESDMAAGLLYVMGRMQWYMSLVRGLLDGVDQERKNEQLRLQLKNRILSLYTDILSYQMQSVCYCYHDLAIMKALRAVVALDDWKGQLESIQQLEAVVQKDMHSFAAVETLASLAEIAHSTRKLDVIWRELKRIVTLQEQTRQEEEERHLEAERTIQSKLVGRFKTVDYEKQMKLNPSRIPGTCEWFCSHEKFKKWLSCKGSGLLLASADPGCGKSTLARYLVEEVLPERTGATILYFFFKDTPEQRLLANALCAVLHQLFYQKTHVAENFKHQILQSVPRNLSDISTLWALFAKACQTEDLGEVICVFDALDECEQEGVHMLATSLSQLLQTSELNGGEDQTRLKFLITTRGYPSILEQFSDVDPDLVYLSGNDEDEKDQIQAEIGLFLDYQLERLSQKKHFKPERKDRIKEALKAKGSGQRTYLWLTLMFQLLESTFKTTTRDWEKLIAKPPLTVNKAYESLLSRVDEDDKESVQVLLHLIIAARRPLTLCEMNIALNVRNQSDAFDEESLGLSTDEEFKQWLVHTCGFFVTVYSERVYFIHETAKEFLLRSDFQDDGESNHDWSHSITIRSADRMMAESCIAYLSLKQFSQRAFQERASELHRQCLVSEDSPEDMELSQLHSAEENLFTNYKFVQYVLQFWTQHFRECQCLHEAAAVVDIGDTFFDKYLALFATTSSSPPLWFSLTLHQYANLVSRVDLCKEYRDEMIHGYSLWKAAAHCNHIRLLQYAIQSENGRGAGCCTSGIPLLHLAIFEDSSTDFLGLLARHVNVDAPDNISGDTALSMASSMGYWRVVDTLLDHGADPKLANNDGFSPLSHAVWRYCFVKPPEQRKLITTMKRFFSHGADADSTNVLWELDYSWDTAKVSVLEIAAAISGDLEDLQNKLETVVASRSGGMNPHVSTLTQIVMCPKLDLFSEPAFLDAFDESFIKFLVDHGATGIHQAGQIWRFYELIGNRGPDCDGPGYYDDSVVWGIAFLLHAGASPHQLGVRDENEESEISRTEIIRLLSDIAAFGGRPATWMLLLKLLGYDPLSSAVKDGFKGAEFRNILHQAIAALQFPSADWVWFLLEHGQDIEDRDKKGNTPLHMACMEGRLGLKTVGFLLQRGADVNAKNGKAQTPLHLARNAEVVEILCEHGADLNARDHKEHTPLNTMYESGSLEVLRILLKHNANTTARDIEGMTPLHLACNFSGRDGSNAERAKLLLVEHHADIDARDAQNRTPLHIACEQDSAELIETLLAFKADPVARNSDGQTPFHVFLRHRSDHEAEIPMAKLLLAHIVDIEARDLKGRTALHQAVLCGENGVVELLLAHGADVDARDSRSNTPLHLCSSPTSIGLLLDYGADIEARDSFGDTPIHRACRGYDWDIEALLPYQPSLEARNLSGMTPLHSACQYHGFGVAEILLKQQVDIEARDSLGKTPLHYACQFLHLTLVRSLLEHGADIEASDLTGTTPLKLVHDMLESSDATEPETLDRERLRQTIELLCQFGAHVESEIEQSIQELSLLHNGD